VIPKDCKRLAEVDFPIAEVSRHAAREKSIRHGHPSTLHLWWARRPLASSRAVLLGLLLPDPGDSLCPEEFKEKARELLPSIQGSVGPTEADLRKSLLKFIADFANWDLAANRRHLEVSRGLIRAAHGEELPLVVDPFAGGGSIPLEALRLGCEAFASDLNPVACLVLRVMLEVIPRRGWELGAEVRRVGAEIKQRMQQELVDLYPKDPDGGTPIAYLWARTVRCESPNCGAEIPLVRSWWLSKALGRTRAFRHRVVRLKGEAPHAELEIFEPKTEEEVPAGTVSRARATCIGCGAVLRPERVRAQLGDQRGGADVVFDKNGRRIGGARLLAVVTLEPHEIGRQYRLATERDYEAVHRAQGRVARLLGEWVDSKRKGLCPVPDEPLPSPPGKSEVTKDAYYNFMPLRLYGYERWGDLFTARQKASLEALIRIIGAAGAGQEVNEILALSVSRYSDIFNAFCRWENTKHQVRNLFTRQALPILWDFAEGGALGEQAGDHSTTLETMIRVLDVLSSSGLGPGQVHLADAAHHPLPDESASVWFSDPPYYDAVPYADLSDFFFVWLKRSLSAHPLLRDPFDSANPLTPKPAEIIDSLMLLRGVPKARALELGLRVKGKRFYENGMAHAFAEGRRVLREDGVGAVVFAHKTTEGWEALLSGMIRGGWTITGSWPIATELANRPRARESAALATSVHLVCRPRPGNAGIGDWAGVLRELPGRVGDWMERLQVEGVRGADLVFACIGPALEIFSRYSKVETADGREVALAEYLEKVWEVVGRSALAQVLGTAEARVRNGAAGAVEEDARLTALFLWTLQSTRGEQAEAEDDEDEDEESPDEDEDEEGSASGAAKGYTLVFDVVRRFAQPLGIELDKWKGRVVETKKGVVRLLPVAERAGQLFGEHGAQAVAARLEQDTTARDPLQGMLFPEMQSGASSAIRGRGQSRGKRTGTDLSDESLRAAREATTLDRVHAAMLLQAGGRTNALRTLLKSEQERSPDFLRLANALSALYPKGSEEKRLLEAMLLAVPR
jgi:adenine-specific DNA methylase